MRKEYKGILVYNDTYYISLDEIDQTKEYDFKQPLLIEKKESKDKVSYKTQCYYGNGSVYDAIDVYHEYKDKEFLMEPASLIFNHWFNVLKRDTKSFNNTYGMGRLSRRFFDLESCLDYWREFALLDEEMGKFLTDDKIKEFWFIQNENDKIRKAKDKLFDELLVS